MSYAFRPGRAFTGDFKRVGGEQFEQAIELLRLRADGVHEAIHGARKCFKRVRALYRLIAADAPLFQKQENARIRDMARSLSTVRDAAALVENARYLHQGARSDDEEKALGRICARLVERRDRIAAGETDIEDRIAATIVNCEQAMAALGHVSFDDRRQKTAKRLATGWRRTLKRAGGALEACQASTEAAAFHELRKRAQDYRMHLALMRQAWPSAMQAKRLDANALVDTLGHLNDLDVMTSVVNEDPGLAGNSQDQAHLISAVIARQDSLRQEALKRAANVFLDAPKDESRTIRLLWLEAGR